MGRHAKPLTNLSQAYQEALHEQRKYYNGPVLRPKHLAAVPTAVGADWAVRPTDGPDGWKAWQPVGRMHNAGFCLSCGEHHVEGVYTVPTPPQTIDRQVIIAEANRIWAGDPHDAGGARQ